MGDYCLYQPLTKTDKITVVLYRAGIVLSASVIATMAAMLFVSPDNMGLAPAEGFNILLMLLYFSVGLSVFFIHLYMGNYKRNLRKLYFIAIAALVFIFFSGGGDALLYLTTSRLAPLLMLPIAGCLGFITAKEAFCFKLIEGYLLALIMPFYLLLFASGLLPATGIRLGLSLIAAMLVVFTLRKVFMPIHCDIGDKSAYR